jgi:hypothetical protein
MVDAGFTDGELKQLYVMATAHVDDVGEDFVPDMDMLAESPVPAVVAVAVAVPQEMIEAQLVEEALQHDEMADALLDTDNETESDAEEHEESTLEVPQDDPGATQLSLF